MNTKKGASNPGSRRTASRSRPAKTIDLKAEETATRPAKSGVATAASSTATSSVPKTGASAKPAGKPPQKDAKASGQTTKPMDAASTKSQPAGQAAQPRPDKTVQQASAPDRSVRQSGIIGLLAASLVGGLLALGILGGLNSAGLLGAIPGLGGLLTNDQSGDPAPDLAAIRVDIESIRTEQAQLSDRLDDAAMQEDGTAAIAELTTRVTTLDAEADALARRMDTLATGGSDPVDAGANGLAEEISTMGDRLSALETELAALKATEQPALSGETLAQSIAALETRVDEKLEALAAQIEELRTNGEAVAAVSQQVEALETALADLQEARAARSQSEDRIARSVAANALRSGYERGEPFSSILASVQALTGPLDAAASLEQQAVTGVTTTQQLATEFDALASQILRQAQPAADGVVSQLLSNARSLVRVRPSGPMDGTSPQAIVSRIEDRLESADLEGALEQWNTLPDPARAISGDWAAAVEARLAADQAISRILQALTPAPSEAETGQSG